MEEGSQRVSSACGSTRRGERRRARRGGASTAQHHQLLLRAILQTTSSLHTTPQMSFQTTSSLHTTLPIMGRTENTPHNYTCPPAPPPETPLMKLFRWLRSVDQLRRRGAKIGVCQNLFRDGCSCSRRVVARSACSPLRRRARSGPAPPWRCAAMIDRSFFLSTLHHSDKSLPRRPTPTSSASTPPHLLHL